VKKRWLCAILAGIFLLSFALFGCQSEGGSSGTLPSPQPTWELRFLSTGKSDCILLFTNGGVLINDTADENDYAALKAALDARAIRTVDYLILSHFDKDHIGSAYELLNNYTVKTVLMPAYSPDTELYRSLLRALEAEKCEVHRLQADVTFTLGETEVTVYAPQKQEYNDENNYSLVTSLQYGEVSVLLMGDALKERTEELLDTLPQNSAYSLVKLPHHGDSNAKLRTLLRAVSPRFAVLTSDASRSEMDAELPQFLVSIDCTLLSTQAGDIVFTADKKQLTLVQ